MTVENLKSETVWEFHVLLIKDTECKSKQLMFDRLYEWKNFFITFEFMNYGSQAIGHLEFRQEMQKVGMYGNP